MIIYDTNKSYSIMRQYSVWLYNCRPQERPKLNIRLLCNLLEGNQNKNNLLVRNFYSKLKFAVFFSHLFRTENGAGKIFLL